MEPPSINLSPQDQAKVPGYPYYVLGPGSLRPIKLWPPERFGQLALAIWQKCGLKAILIGAPSDEEVGGVVVQVAGAAVTNFIGRTTLKEALAVIRKSSLLIANDSALVHMAGYLGVPSVALLGGGYVGRFLPYPESANWLAPVRAVMKTMPCFHCEWRCRYPIGNQLTAPCIAQIEVSDVMRAAADLLPTSSSPRK